MLQRLLLPFVCLALPLLSERLDPDPFLVPPYIQLGNAPALSAKEQLVVMWHTADAEGKWRVEYRIAASGSWKKAEPSVARRIAVQGILPHRVYSAVLKDLAPGKPVNYRVTFEGKIAFEAQTTARKAANQPYRFAVFGDCAQGTPEQRAVAWQTYQAKPDFVAIAGDIVYGRGLISEYRQKYFPVYNSDVAAKEVGVPLIRSTLFMAAPGNHDVGGNNLAINPDGLAYFLYWAQPLNGFVSPTGSVVVQGESAQRTDFIQSAGQQFPRMANFSFDYGNAHWTVIDSNKYSDWTLPELRQWLKNDLASARNAKWRFVLYHHPGINSSKAHFGDQWMRMVAPVFEEGNVDVVFAGHVHNYQRSHPLRFVPDEGPWRSEVSGKWTFDKTFDGASNTKPKGVIYLVTGAGGAKLYNPEQSGAPSTWQEFTNKFVSHINSVTVVDAQGDTMNFRQIGADGTEVDRFTLTR